MAGADSHTCLQHASDIPPAQSTFRQVTAAPDDSARDHFQADDAGSIPVVRSTRDPRSGFTSRPGQRHADGSHGPSCRDPPAQCTRAEAVLAPTVRLAPWAGGTSRVVHPAGYRWAMADETTDPESATRTVELTTVDRADVSLLDHGQSILRRHEGLWGLLVVPFLALELLSISRGSSTTALTILQSAGPLEVAVGVAIVSLPLILVAVSIWISISSIGDPFRDVGPRIAIAYFLLFTFAPWPMVMLALGASLVLFAGRAAVARLTSADDDSIAPMVVTLAALYVAYSIVVPLRPWLPAEAVTLEDASTVVGYVLSTDDGRVTMLRDFDRRIVVVDADAVETRVLCEVPGSGSERRPLDFLRPDATASYPDCPNPQRDEASSTDRTAEP